MTPLNALRTAEALRPLSPYLQGCKQVGASDPETTDGDAAPRGGGLLPRICEGVPGLLCLPKSLLGVLEGQGLGSLLCNPRW